VYPDLLKYFEKYKVLPAKRYILEIAMLQIFLLAFADDAVLVSHSAEGLKHLFTAFQLFCKKKGL
jgi:hypothetical protein